MNTQKELYNMFIENTGAVLGDSGDAYGRRWQNNRVQHPADRPAFEYDDVSKCWTTNTYKYLINQCGLRTDEICTGFNNRNRRTKEFDADANIYGVGHSAWNWLNDNFEVEVQGEPWNTYNEEGDWQTFDQCLQGTYLKINGDYYVCLQVHGGCDVRGGYTIAKLFLLSDICLSYPVIEGTVTRNGETFSISDIEYGDGRVYMCDDNGNETEPYEWREGDVIA